MLPKGGGGGQTDAKINTQTLQLIDSIGQEADCLKKCSANNVFARTIIAANFLLIKFAANKLIAPSIIAAYTNKIKYDTPRPHYWPF